MLVNLIYGLYDHKSPVRYVKSADPDLPGLIQKTHTMPSTHWLDENTDFFVVSSERVEIDKCLSKRFKNHERVIVFQYEELLYHSPYSPQSVRSIEEVTEDLGRQIDEFLGLDGSLPNAINRLKKMAATYESIKDRPFSFCNQFYHIHGSHRQRDESKN